ncbi:hypothetical protein P879_10309, partial [Paragonimus westermani]
HCSVALIISDRCVLITAYKYGATDLRINKPESPRMKLTFCVLLAVYLLATIPATQQQSNNSSKLTCTFLTL